MKDLEEWTPSTVAVPWQNCGPMDETKNGGSKHDK